MYATTEHILVASHRSGQRKEGTEIRSLLLLLFCAIQAITFSPSSPGNPKALTSQCRLAVRRYLRKINKIHCIDQLEMPTSLINFLQHKPVQVTVLQPSEPQTLYISALKRLIELQTTGYLYLFFLMTPVYSRTVVLRLIKSKH